MSDAIDLPAAPVARDLLRDLRARGIDLTLENGSLRAHAPAGAMTFELQAAIRSRKQELIALLAGEVKDREEERGSVGGAVLLAPAQERLWLFQQLQPDAATYNLSPVVQIHGTLDVPRLERAVGRLLSRHEPLRSVVGTDVIGGVIRTIAVPDNVLEYVDFADLAEVDRSAAVNEFIRDRQSRGFDLAKEIPFRAVLVRLGFESHLLVTTMHHIAVDGVSLDHLFRDLAAFYEGTEVPPLRASYSDYAAWQRAHWTPERSTERIRFWKDRLQGATGVLELPTDFARSANQSFAGGVVSLAIGGESYRDLMALARAERASLFMVMLAALTTVLHQHSGQRDIIVGTPLHGRDRPEFSDLVGMFVNQLPLRMQVGRDETMRQVLRRARDTTLGSMADSEIPFGALVDALDLPRDPSRNPLFQVMLNVLPPVDRKRELKGGGISFRLPELNELLAVFDGQSRFDITLYVVQQEHSLDLVLNYNSDLFSERRMQLLLANIRETLDFGIANPDNVLESGMVAAALSRQDSVAGPDPDTAEESVSSRFLRVAEQHAGRPAILAEGGEVTYAELLAESRRIARLVTSASEQSGSAVGIFVPHDSSVVPAILGVLLAGRPYVPLDPSYPEGRLAYMAEDSGAADCRRSNCSSGSSGYHDR